MRSPHSFGWFCVRRFRMEISAGNYSMGCLPICISQRNGIVCYWDRLSERSSESPGDAARVSRTKASWASSTASAWSTAAIIGLAWSSRASSAAGELFSARPGCAREGGPTISPRAGSPICGPISNAMPPTMNGSSSRMSHFMIYATIGRTGRGRLAGRSKRLQSMPGTKPKMVRPRLPPPPAIPCPLASN